MRERRFMSLRIAAILLLLPIAGLAQTTQQSTTFMVAGHTGTVPIVQLNGKSYVDLEGLARITEGSLRFRPNLITLTLAAPSTDQPTPRPNPAFTRAFLNAGIEEMTVIREWRIAIVNAVQTNNPVVEDWVAGYRRNADSKLALANAAATSDSDRKALPLLQGEFNNMQTLSDKYIQMHLHADAVRTDALDDDDLALQVLSCAQGLQGLVASGTFEDVFSCH